MSLVLSLGRQEAVESKKKFLVNTVNIKKLENMAITLNNELETIEVFGRLSIDYLVHFIGNGLLKITEGTYRCLDADQRVFVVVWQVGDSEERSQPSRSWNNFVDDELSKNPWGTVYKLASNKLKTKVMPVTMTKPDGTRTRDIPDTLEGIVNTLIPADDPALDEEFHLQLRNEYNMLIGDPEELAEVNLDNLDCAISQIK